MRREEGRTRGVLGSVLLLAGSCALPALREPAPLMTRNQHPVHLTAIHAGARPVRAVPAGAVELTTAFDWTSLWLQPGAGSDRIELDGELLRLTPGVRVGLGGGVDVGLEIPFLHAGGGSLDSVIEAWHDLFGLPQNRRDDFPRDRFAVEAERRDEFLLLQGAYELDPGGIELGDVPVTVAWFPGPLQGDGWRLGLRGGVELPTGDEGRGYGNGGLDAMVGFVGGWSEGPVALAAWGGWTWVRTPDAARRAGLEYQDRPALGAGVELALTDWLSCVSQIEWERSLLRDLDNEHADLDQALIWIGGRARLSEDVDLEAAVGEDLIRNVSPDITFHLGLRVRL